VSDDITSGEIGRRLDDLSRQITTVLGAVESERRDNGATYLRAETYRAERDADRAEVAVIVKRSEAAEAMRRQILAGISVTFIGMAVSLVLGLSSLVKS
jgi:hypothetical protein